jgi:hypothetical protein
MALALQEALQSRPAGKADLVALVAIDAAHSGRRRRGYFERRLATALRDRERDVQVAVVQAGQLLGFMLGRVLEGEFGRVRRAKRGQDPFRDESATFFARCARAKRVLTPFYRTGTTRGEGGQLPRATARAPSKTIQLCAP